MSGEIMVGKLGPYTSASKMPTLAPICARVNARLTAVVDLPTPPLQEDTAMMLATRLSPFGRPSSGRRGAGGRASMRRLTSFTQGSAATLARASRSKSSLMGQAGVVNSRRKDTEPVAASMTRSFTKPQSTMFIPKSGSMIVDRLARTTASRDWTGVEGGEAVVAVSEDAHTSWGLARRCWALGRETATS